MFAIDVVNSFLAAKSLDELRQRLRDKIECLKQSRLEKEKKESKKRGPPKTKQHLKQQQQEQTEQTEQTEPESKRIKVEKSKEKEEISEKAPTPSVNDVISKYSIFPRL